MALFSRMTITSLFLASDNVTCSEAGAAQGILCKPTNDEAFVPADHMKWGEAFSPPLLSWRMATLYFPWKSRSPDIAHTRMNTRGLYLSYLITVQCNFHYLIGCKGQEGFSKETSAITILLGIHQPS